MNNTDRPVWLVTGSSTGFGRTLVEKLLEQGFRVIATARRPEQLADLVSRYPETARALQLDVTSTQSIAAGLQAAQQQFGRIDVLVNNAGYGLLGALEEVSDEEMRSNLETNFIGPLNVIRAALPLLRAQQRGFIVNLSAIAAFNNELGFSIYGGAKAGLEAATEALAGELKPLGIRVMIVSPGPFRTDFIGRSMVRSASKIAAYERSVGKFAAFLEKINGQQPGDPVKAAEAIIQAVTSDHPPLRLFLGAYALNKVRQKLKAVEADLQAWESVALDTDFTDAANTGH